MSNLTKEQVERNQAWANALRKNEKKAFEEMRDADGGRCCLCVAYDLAQEQGAELPINDCDEIEAYPPMSITDWYGWNNSNPILSGNYASSWNDGADGSERLTHAEIADLVEAEFCKKEGAA